MKRLFVFDETDTVVATSKDAARFFYQEETGFSDEEMVNMEVKEIPPDEWPNKIVQFDELEELQPGQNEDDREYIKMTLAEYVEQFDENEPQIVCSTEC